MVYFVSKAAQGANQYIMGNIGPQVPYMGVVIDRGPAAVKTCLPKDKSFKVLKLSPQGVKKA